MILKGSEEANALKKEHIKQARRALEACKSWRTKTSKDARNNRIIDFQKLIFQNPSKIHKNRDETPLKYIHLQAL
jgi:hypothetical protein